MFDPAFPGGDASMIGEGSEPFANRSSQANNPLHLTFGEMVVSLGSAGRIKEVTGPCAAPPASVCPPLVSAALPVSQMGV